MDTAEIRWPRGTCGALSRR